MANEIKDIGSGTGKLYVTTPASVILRNLTNNLSGVRSIINIATTVGIIPWEIYQNGGGAPPLQDEYDSNFGFRFYINADYGGAAPEGSLVAAVEITKYIVSKGLQSNINSQIATISGGVLTVTRKSVLTKVYVDTEGAAPTDFLDEIAAGEFIEGDFVVIAGVAAGRVSTLRDVGVTAANIHLAKAKPCELGDEAISILLQYVKPNLATAGKFVEVSRTDDLTRTVADIRAEGLPAPIGGVDTQTIASIAGGVTITLTPGVSKQVLQITGGPTNITGNIVITTGGVPIDGDSFVVMLDALANYTAAFTITIFGITLTAAQALRGGFRFEAVFDTASYRVNMINDARYLSTSGAEVFYVQIPISQGDTQTLFSVGKAILGGLGANQSIRIKDAVPDMNVYNGTPYATSGNMQLGCVGASSPQYSISANGFLFGTVARRNSFVPQSGGLITDTQIVKGAGIELTVTGADPTANGSPWVLHMWYTIIES